MKAGPGRPKGSLNRSTASVKAALVEAFDKRGGVPALIAWADAEPTEFYKLWGKMIPTEVEVTGTIELAATVEKARKRANQVRS